MEIQPIKTETDYKSALKKLELIFDAPLGSEESDMADILGLMIDEYEKKHHFIDACGQGFFHHGWDQFAAAGADGDKGGTVQAAGNGGGEVTGGRWTASGVLASGFQSTCCADHTRDRALSWPAWIMARVKAP